MNKNFQSTVWLMSGVLTGIGIAYLMDPQSGRRRRALIQDKFHHWGRVTDKFMHQKSHHFQNRLRGYGARLNILH